MEVKQPSKLKEIEAKGRMAALEAKLAAINEMIENITSSLTRLEEDDTMAEMMDKAKMKEMRKEVKLLERMKDKVEKEKAKMEGKGMKSYKSKEVMDEDTVDESINENQMHDELLKLVMRYVKDPDEAADQAEYIITSNLDMVDDMVQANLERDPDYKNWAERMNAAQDFEKSLRNLNESKARMQKLAGLIKG